MEIIIRDDSGACPACQGMLRPIRLHSVYKCVDCQSIYRAIEDGYDEYGVIMAKKERSRK